MNPLNITTLAAGLSDMVAEGATVTSQRGKHGNHKGAGRPLRPMEVVVAVHAMRSLKLTYAAITELSTRAGHAIGDSSITNILTGESYRQMRESAEFAEQFEAARVAFAHALLGK